MKTKTIFSLIIISLLFAGCNPPQEGYEISSEVVLVDKAIVLSYDEVNSYLPEELGDNHIVVVDGNGDHLPSQCDDLDNDGKWDELVFLVDLNAGESKTLFFNAVPEEEVPDYPRRTNVRFGYAEEPFVEVTTEDRLKTADSSTTSDLFQLEGPAWENDLVAFRNYYDSRNGIDIFGKTVNDMVLDSVGVKGQNYREMDDWGMDILKVGNSLGAGAIGIRIGEDVTRVGEFERGTYELITEGPVRSILKLNYFGVPVGERIYDITHQISIYAGDHFYRSQVNVDGLRGDEQLVTGIVNMKKTEALPFESNGYQVVASHGNQGYMDEILGMAIIVPQEDFIETWPAPEEGEGIVETHMVALELNEGQSAEYYFFSGWEYQNEGFKTLEFFEEEIEKATVKLAN